MLLRVESLASPASPGNSEMQTLRSHSRSAESNDRDKPQQSLCCTTPPSDSDARLSLRTTALERVDLGSVDVGWREAF